MTAKISYDFYDKKNIYNDGEVENRLLEYYKNHKEIDFEDDQVFYLTTDSRQNVLSWYPFEKDSTILEIGSGCGTITSILCDKSKKVVSIEASKKRAEINYYRNNNKDNLEIYVSNINDLKINQKFDYIVLVGVFEYSKIFFDVENPFDYALNLYKKLLNKNGRILIAIENRLGIKYFAGNKEDHIGKSYVGLEGYGNSDYQTFGRKEISEIFKRNGFNNIKFYSMFPDYKLPQIVFSDDYKFSEYELKSFPIYNHNIYETYNFDYRKTLYGLQQNGLLNEFANSYLCEISPDKKPSKIDYVKFQGFRNKKYNLSTVICKDTIYKTYTNVESIEHLKNIERIHKELISKKIPCCNAFIKDYKLYMEKVSGKSIEDILNEHIYNKKKIFEVFDKYVLFLKTLCDKRKINSFDKIEYTNIYKSNTLCLKHSLLDLNCGNVFFDNGNFYIIDQEFDTKYDIPLDYVIYFSIKLFFEKINKNDCVDLMDELYDKYNITDDKKELFDSISRYYFTDYMKINNQIKLIKILNHKNIIIDQETNNLKNDLEFYKSLLEKTKDGYEKEIKRITEGKFTRKIKKILNKLKG